MKHFIFDIDGTIWNTTEIVAKGWNKAVKEAGIEKLDGMVITASDLQKEFGKPMNVIADDIFGDIGEDNKDRLLKLCCKYEEEALLENTEDVSYEGLFDTMKKLSEDNKLYIVSNCQDGYIEIVMEKNNISSFISDYECFGRTGLQKDENISLVIERNSIPKEDAYYIGDIYGDYVSTKKAGISFIFASYGFGEVYTPDYTITKFSDLLDFVQ